MANVIQFTILGVDKFSSTFSKIGSTISAVGKKLVSVAKWAAAAAAALVGFVTVVANGIDKVAKFATRIGVAVEELSRMQFVASQAGISNEQFNMATQRMTRRVAEAAQGFGEASGALSELGINAKEFSKLGLEDQFTQLAGSISQVQNPADQLRIAFKLFDSEGTAVLQMLKQGSPAMQAMARDADFLGLTLSKQAAANAEHFTNSMGRATGSMKGVSRAISNELMPLLSGLANRFADTLARNRQNIVNFVKNVVVGFFTFIEVLRQIGRTFAEIFNGNQEVLSRFLDGLGNYIVAVGRLFLNLGVIMAKGVYHGILLMKDLLGEFGYWFGGWLESLFSGRQMEDLSDHMSKALIEGMKRATTDFTESIQPQLENIGVAFEDLGTSITEGLGINLEDARLKANEVMAGLVEFGEVVREEMTLSNEMLSEMMLAFREEQNIFMDETRNNTKIFVKELFKLVRTTIDQMSKAIAATIVYGNSLAQAFKAIAKQVLAQVIAALVKMGIQRLILMVQNIGATKAEASGFAAAQIGGAAAAATKSQAAAPWPLNLTAPAVGAATGAAAAGLYSSYAATGASLGAGIAHGGLDNVPAEQTYLLDKGERVLSPNQNRDLTDFLASYSGLTGPAGNVTIEEINIEILPNATSIDALLGMSELEIEELVAGPIISALNRLDKRGVRQDALERGGS